MQPASVAIDRHQRLLQGLPGEALLVSASMFLSSLAEAESLFGLSFKTVDRSQKFATDGAGGSTARVAGWSRVPFDWLGATAT